MNRSLWTAIELRQIFFKFYVQKRMIGANIDTNEGFTETPLKWTAFWCTVLMSHSIFHVIISFGIIRHSSYEIDYS